MLSFSGLGGLRASSLEASGLHDTNLNTLSTQTPRGQKLQGYIEEEWQIKMMALFFFIAHEKGFTFHTQTQTGAYSCYDYNDAKNNEDLVNTASYQVDVQLQNKYIP